MENHLIFIVWLLLAPISYHICTYLRRSYNNRHLDDSVISIMQLINLIIYFYVAYLIY